MKILFVNWKDITNPASGGAEVVADQLCQKMVADNHQVTFLTATYPGAKTEDSVNGYQVIRIGTGKFTQAFAGLWYYLRNLRNKYDVIIDTVNTAPYFIGFFRGKSKYFLFYHQLAEEVWDFETKPPLSWIGRYLLEPVATWLNGLLRVKTITISESTKNNLTEYGFRAKAIEVIREGITNTPLAAYKPNVKAKDFTVLFFSSLRQMKRPDEAIRAFALFAKNKSEVQMWVGGDGEMRVICENLAEELGVGKQITFYGRKVEQEKLDLMQKASIFVSTSIKEGWGLIVTEANSMATPALCYNVDGLRDAAKQGGGKVVDANPEALAKELENTYQLFQNSRKDYDSWCAEVLEKSREITFDNSYQDLKQIIFR